MTVYREDAETEAIWLNEMNISPTRFSRCGEEDNFWSLGKPTCGPCTEIFFDHGVMPGDLQGVRTKRGIVMWNLVFALNRDAMGQLTPLPRPCVDTGMGLERIASVMQGVHDKRDRPL